jgi:hypothetical protein
MIEFTGSLAVPHSTPMSIIFGPRDRSDDDQDGAIDMEGDDDDVDLPGDVPDGDDGDADDQHPDGKDGARGEP